MTDDEAKRKGEESEGIKVIKTKVVHDRPRNAGVGSIEKE